MTHYSRIATFIAKQATIAHLQTIGFGKMPFGGCAPYRSFSSEALPVRSNTVTSATRKTA